MILPESELFDTNIIIIGSNMQKIATKPVKTSRSCDIHNCDHPSYYLGTYNLQYISVVDYDVDESKLCLEFTFVGGTTITQYVHIALESIGNVKFLNYTSSDKTKSYCISDVSPHKWLLRGCDGPPGDDRTCKDPAFTLHIDLSNSTRSSTTSTAAPPSYTPTPTATPGIIIIIIVYYACYIRTCRKFKRCGNWSIE